MSLVFNTDDDILRYFYGNNCVPTLYEVETL